MSDNPLMKRRQEFWGEFKNFETSKGTKLPLRKPSPDHWYDVSIGSSHAHVSLKTITRDDVIRCELWIDSRIAKRVFDYLYEQKEEIEKEVGQPLQWLRLEDAKVSRIILETAAKQEAKETWETQFSWLLTNAQKFNVIFGPRLKKIPRDGLEVEE